ncbi:MAG: hypothetical protein ACHQ15_08415, partial [Candidatus Limnocylindrales bacterium]
AGEAAGGGGGGGWTQPDAGGAIGASLPGEAVGSGVEAASIGIGADPWSVIAALPSHCQELAWPNRICPA